MNAIPTHADIESTNLGSIIILEWLSPKGRKWLASHVGDPLAQAGEPIYCDHRCGMEILYGAVAAGLRLRDGQSGRIAR